MYIYADILIITNIYMDYILLECVRLVTHSPLRKTSAAAASIVGSLFSLTIFLHKINTFCMLLIKIVSAAVVIFTAFGYESRTRFFRRFLTFFIASFVFAGVGTAISDIFSGKLIISKNGVIYMDFSPAALIITSAAAYIVMRIYRCFSEYSDSGGTYTIIVAHNGKTVSFKAMSDTGNILRDSFSGKAVIVCPSSGLDKMFGITEDFSCTASRRTLVRSRARLIPYKTVSGMGLIPIILPDEIVIVDDNTGEYHKVDAYIGLAENTETAVFNPNLLS